MLMLLFLLMLLLFLLLFLSLSLLFLLSLLLAMVFPDQARHHEFPASPPECTNRLVLPMKAHTHAELHIALSGSKSASNSCPERFSASHGLSSNLS